VCAIFSALQRWSAASRKSEIGEGLLDPAELTVLLLQLRDPGRLRCDYNVTAVIDVRVLERDRTDPVPATEFLPPEAEVGNH
jgi:hypothetical protein